MSEKREILIQVSADARKADAEMRKAEQGITALKKQLQELKDAEDKDTEAIAHTKAELAGLKSEKKGYTEQLKELTKINRESISLQGALNNALGQSGNSVADVETHTEKLLSLRRELNVNDANYAKNIADINTKIAENNRWLSQNTSQQENLMATMSDAKTKFTESFDAINIFNGGINGFVSRAQEAGGVGKLFTTSLSGMTEGFKGMGKAIMANPFGLLLSLLAPLIQKLMSMPPVTNAIEKAMAALGPILEIVTKPLTIIADLTGAVIEGFADLITPANGSAAAMNKLQEAQQNLAKEMELQEVRNKRAQVLINDQIALSKDQTKTEQERIDAFKKAATIESQNYAQRKKQVNDDYNQKLAQIALNANLTKAEEEQLKKGGFAYAQKLLKVKSINKEELDALKDTQIKREDIFAEERVMIKNHNDGLGKMHEDFDREKQQKRDERQKEAQRKDQEARQKEKDNLNAAAEQQRLLLDKYMTGQDGKVKSLKDEITQANEVYKFKQNIAEAEYAASDRTANDTLKRDVALANAKKEQLAAQSDATVRYAKAETDLWLESHKTLLADGKAVTAELAAGELTRLNDVQKHKTDQLALEKGVNAQSVADKIATNQQLTIQEMEFAKDKLAIDEEYQTNKETLEKAARAQQATDVQQRLENDKANAQTKYDQDVIDEQMRYEAEKAKLDERKAQGLITEQQYDEELKAQKKITSDNLKLLDQAVIDNKLNIAQGYLSQLSSILGKESAAGKAVAVAQATIDTYKSATAAYAAGMALGGPAGLVMGPLAAGMAVTAGIQNVKKITATKTPKAEKGAIFNIGGQRHSAGGTLFTGADGTQFEAEKGELIGVMNRNAARHFMAFNNAFPAGGGSAPNYFASGGIVSREVSQQSLNVDELAAKIAQANAAIPAPVVAVRDIISQGNSYVRVRDTANF